MCARMVFGKLKANPTSLENVSNLGKLRKAAFLSGISQIWMPIMVHFQMNIVGLTLAEVMLIEGIFCAVMLIAEVPSGILADRCGRPRVFAAGAFLSSLGFLMIASSSGFAMAAIAQIVLGLGMASISGIPTSLLFDSLETYGRKRDFVRVQGQIRSMTFMGATVACCFAGLGAIQFPRMTIAFAGFSHLVILILALRMQETTSHRGYRSPWLSFRHLLDRRTWPVVASMVGVMFVAKAIGELQNPVWHQAGVPLYLFGFILAGSNGLASFAARRAAETWKIFGLDMDGPLLAAFLIAASCLLLAVFHPIPAMAILLPAVVRANAPLATMVFSKIINENVPAGRTTALSCLSLLTQLAGFLGLPMVGYFSQKDLGFGFLFLSLAASLIIFQRLIVVRTPLCLTARSGGAE